MLTTVHVVLHLQQTDSIKKLVLPLWGGLYQKGGGVQGVTNPHFRIGHKQKSGKVKFVLLEIHYKPNCFKLSSYIDFVSKIK